MDLMNQTQVASYLGVSVQTIINWEKKGMPVIRHDGIVRYDRDDIDEWMMGRDNNDKNT